MRLMQHGSKSLNPTKPQRKPQLPEAKAYPLTKPNRFLNTKHKSRPVERLGRFFIG
jgi:hypothetical protein